MISSLLYQRSCSNKNSKRIQTNLSTYASRDKLSFVNAPKIISPHSSRITSLDIDNNIEGRFLLCGSRDCTVSIYDLNLLGSDYHVNCDVNTQQHRMHHDEKWLLQNTYHPVCHSRKIRSNPSHTLYDMNQDPNYLPTGHGSPVTQVQWYPVDSGIFLSSDCIGNILLWDTNAFTPASCMSLSKAASITNSTNGGSTSGTWSRSDTLSMSSNCSINSFDLPKNASHHMQLAAGCIQTNLPSNRNENNAMQLVDDRAVYLCDIKSGSTTQQLIGHGSGHGRYGNRGISTVQWSPMNEFILMSGGGDGCIKLWDVRKSGSTACLMTLDQEMKWNSEKLGEYDASKLLLLESRRRRGRTRVDDSLGTNAKKRKKVVQDSFVAPGNYSKVECSSQIQSHDGPIVGLSFTPDGEYVISASPADGIHIWHLQKGNDVGILMPTNFLRPYDTLKHPLSNKQRKVPLIVTQPGSRKSGTVWIGTDDLLGYDIHGMGGRPQKVLLGHIDTITSIASQENSMRLFTGGADGMVLCWGYDTNEND